ncbi:MAG: MBG domain-containing protein, partial [Erysipelotrichaceae bacterium]|nr:MBG domain-containing protein [Erysipelotrichaceae bacterium]
IYTDNTGIRSLNINGLTNLREVRIHNNPALVGDFDLSENTNLSHIYAYNTGIRSLNLDGLTNLIKVDVSNCPNLIGEFDLRANSELEWANLHSTQITNANVTGLAKLKMFSIANTNIGGEFDFTSNTALEELVVRNTGITKINIQGLTNLIKLYIQNNSNLIGDFDFTSNTALELINASNTNIHSINVQGLRNLTQLNIANTLIPSLDVSTNTSLQVLNVSTNLTWLNIADNPNLATLIKKDSIIDLGKIEDSFNIATVTEAFKGIDISKVTMVSGATYDPATGEVSGYQNGTPIVYSYDSGVMQNGEAVTLTVTLNFTKDASESTIRINNYEGKLYDGTPVSNPTDITKTGSSGAVTFEWFTKDENGNWVSLGDQAPVNAGSYGVKAHLAADQNYAAADSGEPTPFEITKARSTISINSYEGKPYDGTAVSNPTEVTTTGSDGAVTFEWFTKGENGDWVSLGDQAPVNAGSYGVKAHLAADQNYAAADSGEPTPFEITKARSTISINSYEGKPYDGTVVNNPTNITTTGSDGLVTFEWFTKDENGKWVSLGDQAPVNVGEYGVKAHLAANQNYAAADSGEPTPFEIIKATSTVEILGDLNKTYDGEAVKDPSVKVEGTSEAATIAWFKKESDAVTRAVTWTPLTSAPVNAGEYKVVVTVAENNNSLGATAEQEFTIAKAATNVSIEGTLDKEYDGVEVEVPNIKVEGSSGATTIEWYKKDANGVWELLTSAPKEVGEYKVVVKVEEDENYLSGEVEQTFTISEKVEVPSTPEEGGDNTTTEEEKVEGVQTGDVTQTSMWTMLVGLSMSMMYFFRRKKNK